MQDIAPVPEIPPHEAETNEPRIPIRLFALKDGDTFMVADAYGDVLGEGDGLFRNDTRILSRYRLILGDRAPSLLSASVSQDNVLFTANLTNRPLPPLGGQSTPEGVIHIERTRFIWQECLYEQIRFVNYSDLQAILPVALQYGADFRDMFEVRGVARVTRGRPDQPVIGEAEVLLGYHGLDGVLRSTRIAFSQVPRQISADRADFLFTLPGRGTAVLYLEIGPEKGERPSRERHRAAAARARFAMRARTRRGAWLRTSGRLFNDWVQKSRADLALLTTDLITGPYPYAGIPWFSTPFGRDAIITALQTLWLDPALARGVLSFLARHQAREISPFQDAAPGKIMHETRKGEMTALRELPFGQYYGGVDTTPLFVMLAGAYAERTGDLTFIDGLWPALEAATEWIEGPGDSNGDGFLDYARGAETGLANQGWKDSYDSIFHADGRFPEGPVALVEVQGYVFAALNAMSSLARRRGDGAAAARWHARAEELKKAVEKRFWMEDRHFYGIALDGGGELCRVRASNAGHLLYVGLPTRDRAAKVAGQLLSTAFNAGWGVRTLAANETHYNPMSYHNGSVWPHDSAVCAMGMARYGERLGVVRLLNDLFEAGVHFGMRLPELYCGFPRAPGEAPVAYPVACLPQAWAAASPFMLLQASLGIRIDGWHGEIHVERPHLPIGVDQLTIERLMVKGARVDLTFQRIDGRIVVLPSQPEGAPIPIFVRM